MDSEEGGGRHMTPPEGVRGRKGGSSHDSSRGGQEEDSSRGHQDEEEGGCRHNMFFCYFLVVVAVVFLVFLLFMCFSFFFWLFFLCFLWVVPCVFYCVPSLFLFLVLNSFLCFPRCICYYLFLSVYVSRFLYFLFCSGLFWPP